MAYVLKNAAQIHVSTSENQKPSEDWLKMVVTSRAKSGIKSAIKEEKKRIGEIGREAMERKFRNLKLNFEENIDTVVERAGYDTRTDLYYDIAQDKTDIQHVFKNIEVEEGKILEEDRKSTRL